MIKKLFKNKFYLAILLLVSLLFIGVFGYRTIAGYNWVDSLYMTVITIATVGYGEVTPLDDGAKLFTVFLILTSVAIIAFSLSVITEYIVKQSNPKLIKRRKVQKMISAFENHIIICGYGRNGKQVAQKLLAHKKNFVIVEGEKEIVDRYNSEKLPMLWGDAIDDEVLKKAGIYKAKTIICTLPEDADNLFIVLSARQMNNDLKIISRASKPSSYRKLKLAGADNVIMPDRIGGDHMASLVVVPDLIEFLDNISLVGDGSVNIEEIPSDKVTEGKTNQSIIDLNIRSRCGCTIIGYKSPEGKYIINPDAHQPLEPKSKIIVLGDAKQIQNLNKLYHITA